MLMTHSTAQPLTHLFLSLSLTCANLPRGGGGGAAAVGGAEDLVNDGELVGVVRGEVGGEDAVLGVSAAEELAGGAG